MPLSPETLKRIRLAYPPAEAAELLSLSRARLYQLIADGTIPSLKIGKSRRITHAALVAFLDGRATGEQKAS